MIARTVRIGGACAFYGDSSVSVPQLLEAGVDYLILDYLAEVAMSVLSMQKQAHPDRGYASDFTEWVWKDNLPRLMQDGVKIVTNAGGVNPLAARARMLEIAAEQGLTPRIAIVTGDDLGDRAEAFARGGMREAFSDEPFPAPDRITSVNAYFGAGGIAEALRQGADVVITGRVVDSALALGPLMHEFGWAAADYDRLAAGTLIGHILECGAQATGGLFTDWRDVEDWAHIGYPIAECAADGSFVLTKPAGTGGLVSPATACEQMLYEVGDPQAYIVPDVVCDFSRVVMTQVSKDRVVVTGARGYPPTSTYKVCATYADGYRAISLIPVLGMEAAAKAHRQGEAVLERTSEMLRARNLPPWRDTRVDIIGADASYGCAPEMSRSREVICKVVVEHEDRAALRIFLREQAAPITSMSPGSTTWYGIESKALPIVRLFSFLLEKEEAVMVVDFEGRRDPVPVPQPAVFNPASIVRPPSPPVAASVDDRWVEVPLVRLAWGRSGDKGDSFNVGVIARQPDYLPYISAALTPERVAEVFAHEWIGDERRVQRFDVPGMNAINFLLHKALGGGGVATMRIDMLAKGKAQQLLETPIRFPASLLDGLADHLRDQKP